MSKPKRFNIRVYGLLIHDERILLSDEICAGVPHTKFPGGGLEFGESTIECLKREFEEEMGIKIDVLGHFYTCDRYLVSAFNDEEQLLSVYYKVSSQELHKIKDSPEAFHPDYMVDNVSQRWLSLSELHVDIVTFPLDKQVVAMLLE